jgi:hypothetical protein
VTTIGGVLIVAVILDDAVDVVVVAVAVVMIGEVVIVVIGDGDVEPPNRMGVDGDAIVVGDTEVFTVRPLLLLLVLLVVVARLVGDADGRPNVINCG